MTTVRPSGRADVMAAVLDAATELFATQGPAATSIREVATLSGVNHGLVYRHFGTKEALVSAVLDHASERLTEAVATGSDVAQAADRQLRVLARAILDGYPVGELQHQFPFVTRLVHEAMRQHSDETEARLAAGLVVALELGWRLFEPFIRAAAGIEGVPHEISRKASRRAGRLLLAAPGGEPSTTTLPASTVVPAE